MADEVYAFSVTVPAGTPIAAPQVTNLTMPVRIVDEVEIVVPPGPHGLVGFALGAAGAPVIPAKSGQYVITDDEKIRWPLVGQLESGAWQCFAYNTGKQPHTLRFRFLVRLPRLAGAGSLAPIPTASLTG